MDREQLQLVELNRQLVFRLGLKGAGGLTGEHGLQRVHDQVREGVLHALQEVVPLARGAENLADLLHHFYSPVHAVQVLLADLARTGNVRNAPFMMSTARLSLRVNYRF